MMLSNSQDVLARQTTERDKIKILLVEDHRVLREALIALLEESDEVLVSNTAASAEEALLLIQEEIDLAVLDISLPGQDGIWLAQKIKEVRPELRLLMLTMHDEAEFVVKALEAGVDGYLTKWAGQDELLAAIHSVLTTGSYLSARVAPLVIRALRSRERPQSLDISDRERKVAQLLLEGLSNPEIAEEIRLSVSTVKADLRSLYTKLDVSSRTEAAAALVQKGIF